MDINDITIIKFIVTYCLQICSIHDSDEALAETALQVKTRPSAK